MNAISVIEKYYTPASDSYKILLAHSRAVAAKAVAIAEAHPELKMDANFVAEAALLHDIGIFLTHAPSLDCYGTHPYICHSYLGADLLRKEGYPKHALVCERHTGTGISLTQIEAEQLPLPPRDMQPQSVEEQVVCFADKFFSKSNLQQEMTTDEVKKSLEKFGQKGIRKFEAWCDLFL